jgi:hypothetical protein
MDVHVEDSSKLFPQVFSHLQNVEKHPDTPLDEDLLRRAERALDASTERRLLWELLQNGEEMLQSLTQNPRYLTRLLERVVLLIPFDDLRTAITPSKLEEGLNSPSIPIQLLCLAYFTRASDSPSGASYIASSSSLVQTLIELWLSVESTEVSERALECIVALLAVDSPDSSTFVAADSGVGEAQGQGLFWRRLFHDIQVYSLFFLWTSLRKSKYDLKTKKGQQQVTISQARLFDFLSRTAVLDWAMITTSTLPQVEAEFVPDLGGSQPYGGLLAYAAAHMIDGSDFLMEVLRKDFFLKLLVAVQEDNSQQVPPRLLEAIEREAGGTEHSQNTV